MIFTTDAYTLDIKNPGKYSKAVTNGATYNSLPFFFVFAHGLGHLLSFVSSLINQTYDCGKVKFKDRE